ncbi:MAG: radical SAM protein [Chitinophagaceae bacterium]
MPANAVLPNKRITDYFNYGEKPIKNPVAGSTMVHGLQKKLVKAAMWCNIIVIAIRLYKNPFNALKKVRQLSVLRDNYRDKHKILKYAKVDGRYFFSYNAPGWPSAAFDKYITGNLQSLSHEGGILALIFAITKKCGYQCEHCFEWESLNKKEVLKREDLLGIIQSFQHLGISQLILSGGEPLNRIDDIIYVLNNMKAGTEAWLFTSGYHFTDDKAKQLKAAGLTGIAVSLEHWKPDEHDHFRGKQGAFSWAAQAVSNARRQKLAVCLSLCATRQFINGDNLYHYAELAKNWGASFIQLIEPKPVGHYQSHDVGLHKEHIQMLEAFYTSMNFSKDYVDHPAVIYHEYYSRRMGCSGGGNHYLYVDTDGDVHNCPFCQKKLFHASGDSLAENIRLMKTGGCANFKVLQ